EQVCQAPPSGTGLIDFLEYTHSTPPPERKGPTKRESRLLAFVLVAGREPRLVHLGPAKAIDEAGQAWRKAVVAYHAPDQAGPELARLVWQPLQVHLTGVQSVLIAPDGPVCGLPFAALPGTKPGSYLIEEWSIGYVTSGRHILELAAAERPA